MTESFIANLERLANTGSNSKALDYVYSELDSMLLSRQFSEVDRVLLATTTDMLSLPILLSMLIITSKWKSELKNRTPFFQRVSEHCRRTHPDRANRLLAGLK